MTWQFKHTADYIRVLTVAPQDLETRLESALVAPPDGAVTLLERLVREPVELVERELPEVDTSGVRRRIEFRPKPWRT